MSPSRRPRVPGVPLWLGCGPWCVEVGGTLPGGALTSAPSGLDSGLRPAAGVSSQPSRGLSSAPSPASPAVGLLAGLCAGLGSESSGPRPAWLCLPSETWGCGGELGPLPPAGVTDQVLGTEGRPGG